MLQSFYLEVITLSLVRLCMKKPPRKKLRIKKGLLGKRREGYKGTIMTSIPYSTRHKRTNLVSRISFLAFLVDKCKEGKGTRDWKRLRLKTRTLVQKTFYTTFVIGSDMAILLTLMTEENVQ